MAASVLPQTMRDYGKWHAVIVSNPSAAEFWRADFYLDVIRIAAELIVAVAIFIFLKPRANKTPSSPQL